MFIWDEAKVIALCYMKIPCVPGALQLYRAVQDVGGAGMLLVNSDESLIPLMTDSRELKGLMIWGASINLINGTAILDILAKSKNLPTLVKIAPREAENATTAVN